MFVRQGVPFNPALPSVVSSKMSFTGKLRRITEVSQPHWQFGFLGDSFEVKFFFYMGFDIKDGQKCDTEGHENFYLFVLHCYSDTQMSIHMHGRRFSCRSEGIIPSFTYVNTHKHSVNVLLMCVKAVLREYASIFPHCTDAEL